MLKPPWSLLPTGFYKQGLSCSPAHLGSSSTQLAPQPPPCTTSVPHLAPRVFKSPPKKHNPPFFPPLLIVVGFGLKLFSKLSLWVDAQESPEVEWEADRSTTCSSTEFCHDERDHGSSIYPFHSLSARTFSFVFIFYTTKI